MRGWRWEGGVTSRHTSRNRSLPPGQPAEITPTSASPGPCAGPGPRARVRASPGHVCVDRAHAPGWGGGGGGGAGGRVGETAQACVCLLSEGAREGGVIG